MRAAARISAAADFMAAAAVSMVAHSMAASTAVR